MRKNHNKIVCIKLVHLPYSKSSVAVASILPGRTKDLSAPLYHGALLSVHTSNSGDPGLKFLAPTPNIRRILSILCVAIKKQCRGIASISAIASFYIPSNYKFTIYPALHAV